MKTRIKEHLIQSIKYYEDRKITGAELSIDLTKGFDEIRDLEKGQNVTFRYYIDFFEKEGKDVYLPSNAYLKEELGELKDFIDSFVAE